MRNRYILIVYLLALITDIVFAVEQGEDAFVYDDYAAVLKDYVDNKGMVNYKKLKAQSQGLESFAAAMDELDPNSYSEYDDKEKIAFWLNAYNGFTLKAIIDNYPIKHSFFKSRIYPKNSIRQISGVWDEIAFKVMGKDHTLEYIEHKILRKKFSDPRIHMAMVCAAIGCPPLRNEVYTGEKLDEQLDDQSRKFLGNPGKFRIDHDKDVVYLSPILKWFAKDFKDKYGLVPSKGPHSGKFSGNKKAILNFISNYLVEKEQKYILGGKYKIKYLDYDWSLNEQR